MPFPGSTMIDAPDRVTRAASWRTRCPRYRLQDMDDERAVELRILEGETCRIPSDEREWRSSAGTRSTSLRSWCSIRRGPQPGCSRRSSQTSASTSAAIWWGHRLGRRE